MVCQMFRSPAIISCETGKMESLQRLRELLDEECSVLLTYRCPYLIPEELFARPSQGAYNIHPSLLPSYAGLNPWTEIFRDGVRHSGVTLHRLEPVADSGEIIASAGFEITPEDTIESAREKADHKAVELLKYLLYGTN